MDELSRSDMPFITACELETILDSSSLMGPREWIKIATLLESNYLLYDGFVVVMGTGE